MDVPKRKNFWCRQVRRAWAIFENAERLEDGRVLTGKYKNWRKKNNMSVSFFELIARVAVGAVEQYSIENKRRQEMIRLQRIRRMRRIIISIAVVAILVIVGMLINKI